MGRNGMGKSTLIRSMLGIVKPRHGEVFVCGTPMTGAEPFLVARKGIAYVPEGRGIFPNLTVRENLVMAARAGPDGRREWTFERVLATFPRLAERLDHGGWKLSGGEQQMLTIGRALMTNPDLLILDEATEGLAPQIAQEIWRIVDDIRTPRHRDADRRQELRGGHRDRQPQRDPREGARGVRGRQRDAARAAGASAQASRGLTCSFAHVGGHRLEYERIEVRRRTGRRWCCSTKDSDPSPCGANFPAASRTPPAATRSSIRATATATPIR